MGILQRLILSKWIRYFLASLTIFILLITIAEVVNGFLRGKYDGLSGILAQYLLKLPMFLSKIFPTSALIASLFTISNLRDTSELSAIFASSFSRFQFLKVIFSAALVVGLIQLLLAGYIEPEINQLKPQILGKEEALEKGTFLARSSLSEGQVWYKNQLYFASFSMFDPNQQSLGNLELHFFNKSHELLKIIKAKKAFYQEGKSWKLQDVEVQENLNIKSLPKLSYAEELTLELEEEPKDFKNFESDLQTLNFEELKNFVDKLDESGINVKEYQNLYYEKWAHGFLCIIFALLPLLSLTQLSRRHHSLGKSLTLGLLSAVGLWSLHTIFSSLGLNGNLPVSIASSLASILLGIYFILRFTWAK